MKHESRLPDAVFRQDEDPDPHTGEIPFALVLHALEQATEEGQMNPSSFEISDNGREVRIDSMTVLGIARYTASHGLTDIYKPMIVMNCRAADYIVHRSFFANPAQYITERNTVIDADVLTYRVSPELLTA